jgi:hypothetical protein
MEVGARFPEKIRVYPSDGRQPRLRRQSRVTLRAAGQRDTGVKAWSTVLAQPQPRLTCTWRPCA